MTPYYITFLNYLGGFEYFYFTADKEFQIDIQETSVTRQNVFPNWPNSWGENADTIDKKTKTIAKEKVVIRSQHLTRNQRDVLKYLPVSPVVQIVLSRTNRLTLIVDAQSFTVYTETDKLFTIQFIAELTNEIPSQRL